jgi:hypothetical protein
MNIQETNIMPPPQTAHDVRTETNSKTWNNIIMRIIHYGVFFSIYICLFLIGYNKNMNKIIRIASLVLFGIMSIPLGMYLVLSILNILFPNMTGSYMLFIFFLIIVIIVITVGITLLFK